MTAGVSLLECLSIQEDRVRLSVPDGVLPGFLIEAFNATIRGQMDLARWLSTPLHWALVDRMATEGLPGARLASVVLAMVLQRTGLQEAAVQRYKAIAAADPHPLILNELAEIHRDRGLPSQALHYREAALQTSGDDTHIRANYALDLIYLGAVDQGLALLGQLVHSGQATASEYSRWLLHLHYVPEMDPHKMLEAHQGWGQRFAPASLARSQHVNVPDPDRKLRIGYISPDFRSHCVAHFFEPLLDGQDRDRFEILGYGNVPPQYRDGVTSRLISKMEGYRCIWGAEDRQVADQIEQDRIDILVDLAGHTRDNRLRVLAYKPAPVQVTYLGYPNTTGMSQIDYRLTDSVVDLPEAQPEYVERLAFLDTCFACYRPPERAPEVSPPPGAKGGRITFGSFTGLVKHNPFLLSLWAEVLKYHTESDLLLRFQGAEDPWIRERYARAFQSLGVDPGRLLFDGWRDSAGHLDAYRRVDIALDTYPWNSHTTTCEALWAGVPVVTLSGRGAASRTARSVLHHLGLGVFAAASGREYVMKAVALARKPEVVRTLRAPMRQRMLSSGLCDVRGHTRALEAVFRQMWRRWCETRINDL